MSENPYTRSQNTCLKSATLNSDHLEGKVSTSSKIIGSLFNTTFLTGEVVQKNSIIGQVIETKEISGELSAAYTTSTNPGEPYQGNYTVIPKVEQQILLTKGKTMLDNVVVYKIPYFEVSNNSGGETVYIADEI